MRRELWWFEVGKVARATCSLFLSLFLFLSFLLLFSDFWRVEWLNEAINVSLRDPKGWARVVKELVCIR